MKHRIVSYKPLVLEVPDFLDTEECRTIVQAALQTSATHHMQGYMKFKYVLNPNNFNGEGHAVLKKVSNVVADLLDTPKHSGEVHPRCDYTPAPPRDRGICRALPLGLHLDTNRRSRRFATAILYLSTVPMDADGSTVFPCGQMASRFSPEPGLCAGIGMVDAVRAAEDLLVRGCEHTLPSDISGASGETLHRAACARAGLSVQPIAGKLVVFFTRNHRGFIEPRSFHGGADILHPVPRSAPAQPPGKWSLQIFKEIPRDEKNVEAYAAERWRALTARRASKDEKHKICVAHTKDMQKSL